jgi:hypothetical protein
MPGRARFAAVVVIAGAAACLAGVGYAAGLVHFTHSSATSAQYPPSKVTICHHTHSQHNPFVTITVSEHALPAHLGHGDTVGPCPPQGTTGAQGPAEVHGNSGSTHGHQGDKGHGKGHTKSVTSPNGNQGKGNHGQGKGDTQHGPTQSHGKGQGKGHGKGKGHDPAHGQGHNRGQTHGNGHGQGHGQGHGPSGPHGKSGKGNGNKP